MAIFTDVQSAPLKFCILLYLFLPAELPTTGWTSQCTAILIIQHIGYPCVHLDVPLVYPLKTEALQMYK